MKMKDYFLLFLLIIFGGCQKAKQEENKIVSPKGIWNILSVVDKTGITPNHMNNLIGGVAVFTETGYTIKNKLDETIEIGLWSNHSPNTFLIIPKTNPFFSNANNGYKLSTTELTTSTIQLKINVANSNEPENNLFLQLTK